MDVRGVSLTQQHIYHVTCFLEEMYELSTLLCASATLCLKCLALLGSGSGIWVLNMSVISFRSRAGLTDGAAAAEAVFGCSRLPDLD